MKTYEEIKKDFKSPKALEALDRVEEAIKYFTEQKIAFNISSIGRYCEGKYESPKTQSIRNNKVLSKYIKDCLKEFKSKNNLKSISKNNNEKSFDNLIFEKIEDESIKQYIKIQQEKYKLLEEKYNNLKQLTKTISQISFEQLDSFNDRNLLEEKCSIESKNIETVNKNNNIKIEDLIEVLNEKYLSHLDIKTKVIIKNDKTLIINENTGSIIFEN